ncbi:MAG: hypothetical protein JJE39_14500 [Vicinamibacteria bacterium]|nr:hypothetical protein [Vicinamibacteria bacterium]
MAPYLKTPLPPTGLDISQVGNAMEVQITAPRTTIENRPLPLIELEWLQAPPSGDFGKLAVPLLREEVAPGELRIKRFPLAAAVALFSVRAYNGRARSGPALPLPFTPAPVPSAPTGLLVANLPAGVELRWINPPGAEPWPSPTPIPTISPSPNPAAPPPGTVAPALSAPSLSPSPSPATAAEPSRTGPPAGDATTLGMPAAQTPATTPPAGAPAAPLVGASPTPQPSPTPTPLLPTGIRIFRTDGTPHLATQPLQASSWMDTSLKPTDKPCYAIRYATSIKPLVESEPTEPVCVQVKDLVPPESPDRLLGDVGPTFVELSWLPSPSGDVSFYRIYRTAEWEVRAMVIQTEGLLLRVRDLRMTPGPRTYEVTAVDHGGNESLPSPALRIVVP